MRSAWVCFVFFVGCASPPAKVEPAKPDPTQQAAYLKTVEELAALNRDTGEFLRRNRPEEAAAAITRGQPLQDRLLAAPHPTLAAMEAVSDREHYYARMLLSNHHDGWARMMFQKNASRWKAWKPQTAETARRLAEADAGIAECDRRLGR